MWSTLDVILLLSSAVVTAFVFGLYVSFALCYWGDVRYRRECAKAGLMICDGEGYLLIKQNRPPADLPAKARVLKEMQEAHDAARPS